MERSASEHEETPPREAAHAIARELSNDRAAFLAFIRGRTRSHADAEDIFQQALVRAAEHAGSLRDPDKLRPWFYRIVRHAIADHRDRSAVHEAKLEELAACEEPITPVKADVCACSLGQLEKLRPDYAEILRRVDLDEDTLTEVASALSITVNNATVRLHRARRALREQLESFCGTCSARACASCSCDA